MTKKKKLSNILWALAYFVVGCCVLVSGCILFHNNYYSFIWVDGYSMLPTLNLNNKTEFGIVDSHKNVINDIQRFDIVTSYYPSLYSSSNGLISDYSYIDENGHEVYTAWNDSAHDVSVASTAAYKIKRVLALPGEEFQVLDNCVKVRSKNEKGIYGEWQYIDYPFKHRSSNTKCNETPIKLGDDEYWVIGDNWSNSIDCKTLNTPINKANIQGVLIAIEGTCTIKTDLKGKQTITNKKYYSTFRVFKR